MLDYAHDEFIKSVEGTYDEDGFVSSLTFITSMERDIEKFGKVVGTEFVLNAKGFDKLVGFRGRSCVDRINALGANFAVVLAPPVKKLEAQGADFGDDWDDGVHDNVRMITVTFHGPCVESVKFEYANGTKTVFGDDHGYIHKDHMKKEVYALFLNQVPPTNVTYMHNLFFFPLFFCSLSFILIMNTSHPLEDTTVKSCHLLEISVERLKHLDTNI